LKKSTEKRVLQAANLAPSEDMLEKIVEIHPMRQVAIMSIVQIVVLAFMGVSMYIVQVVIDSGITL